MRGGAEAAALRGCQVRVSTRGHMRSVIVDLRPAVEIVLSRTSLSLSSSRFCMITFSDLMSLSED